jgi:transcriptional regulator with XRE-family HTH domain
MDKAGFLKNLKAAREKRSVTQKEAADALGISDKTYSKWETGENEPDVDTLCRLAA